MGQVRNILFLQVLWIHFYSWYTNFRGCQQSTNLNVRRKMTI
jgi:hypothetical protein